MTLTWLHLHRWEVGFGGRWGPDSAAVAGVDHSAAESFYCSYHLVRLGGAGQTGAFEGSFQMVAVLELDSLACSALVQAAAEHRLADHTGYRGSYRRPVGPAETLESSS